MHRLNPSRSILYSPLPCSVQRRLLLSLLAFGWLEPIGTPVKNERAEERGLRVILSTSPPPTMTFLPYPSPGTTMSPSCLPGLQLPSRPTNIVCFPLCKFLLSHCLLLLLSTQPSTQEQSLYTDSCSPTLLPPPT